MLRSRISTSGRWPRTKRTVVLDVARLGDHLQVPLGVEQQAQRAAHNRVVVREHNADRLPHPAQTAPPPRAGAVRGGKPSQRSRMSSVCSARPSGPRSS